MLSVTIILFVAIVLLVGVVVYLQRRMRVSRERHLEQVAAMLKKIDQLEKAHEKEVIREAVDLFEREMQQMGADIHDDLVQKLAGFRLFIDRIERARHESEVQAILIKMNGEFKHVVESVRRISHRLYPDGIETGSLNIALQQLCRQFGPYQVTHIHFLPTGMERILPNESLQHIYRITQELINNIIKHTSAWHIWVRINWLEEMLEVEIEDDGFHYERLENATHTGRGLLTLQKRAALIGGTVSYEPAPKGTKAIVRIPG